MPNDPTHSVLRYLHGVVREDAPEATDQALIERFVRARDQSAFTVLLHRHGPLVWRVCRRVLRKHQDAEDAFQATFIVLARKASSLRDPHRLSCWLHGVASRVATKARSRCLHRPTAEPLIGEPSVFDDPHQLEWREVAGVIDEEVARLPEKLRLPFVLCYLMGETNEEAARRIGCPKGTVLSRLSTARQRLRQRLVRRGLVLSAAMFATLVGESGSASEPPSGLVSSTAQLAMRPADAVGAVAILVQGVILSMTLKKLSALALVATLGILLVAGGLLFSQAAGDTPAAKAQPGEGQAPPILPAKAAAKEGEDPALERAKDKEKAREEFQKLVDELEKMEELWTKQRIKARTDLFDLQQTVKLLEREMETQVERGRSKVQSERGEIQRLKGNLNTWNLQILEFRKNLTNDKFPPAADRLLVQIDETEKQVKDREKKVLVLEEEAAESQARLIERLKPPQLQLIELEELLNALERKQASGRALLQSQIDRAEAKINQLEIGDASGPQDASLEKKLDRLLKEVAELRQELKRPTPR